LKGLIKGDYITNMLPSGESKSLHADDRRLGSRNVVTGPPIINLSDVVNTRAQELKECAAADDNAPARTRTIFLSICLLENKAPWVVAVQKKNLNLFQLQPLHLHRHR
jgi:hypothetical protein